MAFDNYTDFKGFFVSCINYYKNKFINNFKKVSNKVTFLYLTDF